MPARPLRFDKRAKSFRLNLLLGTPRDFVEHCSKCTAVFGQAFGSSRSRETPNQESTRWSLEATPAMLRHASATRAKAKYLMPSYVDISSEFFL